MILSQMILIYHCQKNREGPYKAQAQKVYTILREAVINNVMKEYYRHGVLQAYLLSNELAIFRDS